MARTRWLSKREQHVWRAYLDVQRELLSATAAQLFRDSGLSGADYQILVSLSESEHGVLRARELGLAAGWDRSRLSHQVKRMEKRGLVAREQCEEDARGSMVRLTDAGRSAIEAAAPQHVATVRRYFFDQLSDDEVETMGALMDKVLTGLRGDVEAGR
jgi:DNA-binding MarR family transcriptional regulator